MSSRVLLSFLAKGKTSAQTIDKLVQRQMLYKEESDRRKRAAQNRLVQERIDASALRQVEINQDRVRSEVAAVIEAAERIPDTINDADETKSADSDDESADSDDESADNESASVTVSMVPAKRKRHVVSWTTRAVAIFMYLHPNLLNGKAREVASLFGVDRTTFLAWVSTTRKKNFIHCWYHMVKDLTWRKAKQFLNNHVREKYSSVPDSSALPDEALHKYAAVLKGNSPTVISIFTDGVESANRGYLARQKADTFVSLNKNKKHFLPSGKSKRHKARKYQEADNFVRELIQKRLQMGDPITKMEIRDRLLAEFAPREGATGTPSEFYTKFFDATQTKNTPQRFHTWLMRCLNRHGFSTRNKTVCQKVSED